jgi:hypothetical protein
MGGKQEGNRINDTADRLPRSQLPVLATGADGGAPSQTCGLTATLARKAHGLGLTINRRKS